AFVLASGQHIGGGLLKEQVTREPLLGLGVFYDGRRRGTAAPACSTASISIPPASSESASTPTRASIRSTRAARRLTETSLPQARCWAATTTPGRGGLACRSSPAGWRAAGRRAPRNEGRPGEDRRRRRARRAPRARPLAPGRHARAGRAVAGTRDGRPALGPRACDRDPALGRRQLHRRHSPGRWQRRLRRGGPGG